MLTNLFSLFDPSIRLLSVVWIIITIVIFFLPNFVWVRGSILIVVYGFCKIVKLEIDYVIKKNVLGNYSFIGSVFLLVSMLNFTALFPFLFSSTSHMLVTLPLAYSLWLGIIIFSWVKSLSSFLSHLIPVGTPAALISFIVLVELLRNFIRPLALTFRLTANIIAGHLLMSLIGGFLLNIPLGVLLLGSLVQSLLVVIELGVSIIQAYVFSTLLLLYLSEREY